MSIAPDQIRSDDGPDADTRPSADPSAEVASAAHLEKLRQRRYRWRWNRKLALVTVLCLLPVIIVAFISYRYHSGIAARTFLQRAKAAAKENRFDDQAKWLGRYLLLDSNDNDTIVNVALAADRAAESSPKQDRVVAVDAARKQLTRSIARLDDADEATLDQLRERLITRLLQLGGAWLSEAERQVVILDPEEEDPRAMKWLAMAVAGQIAEGIYSDGARNPRKYERQDQYWLWLSNQPPGLLLAEAIDANPNDLDLVAHLISLVNRENWNLEDGIEESADRGLVKKILDRSVDLVRKNEDTRSQLILHRYLEANEDASSARDVLTAAAAKSYDDLRADSESAEGNPDTALPASDRPPSTASLVSFSPAYWDFLCLLEAASQTRFQSPELARQWLGRLMEVDLDEIPSSTVEEVYFVAGRIDQQQGKLAKAIETWESGLEATDPNSLSLLGALASIRAQHQLIDDGDDTLDRFGDALELASRRLASTSEARLSRFARASLRQRIDSAQWRYDVLKGVRHLREGERFKAINQLASALSSTTQVTVAERVAIATKLSQLYQQEGAWDHAAEALEAAVKVAPESESLRARAAEAWNQAGNQQQAMNHWRVAANSDDPAMRLAGVEAMFNHQLSLPPDQRDFSGVRSATADLSNSFETSSGDADLASLRAKLQILTISMPPAATTFEQHIGSPETAHRVASLSRQYPEESVVQAFAATRLAAVGREEEADRAVQRMQAIHGEKHPVVTATQARIALHAGDRDRAYQLLRQAAEYAEPTSQGRWLQQAASVALSGGDVAEAYDAYRSIPADQRSLDVLYRLANLAVALPADARPLHENDPGLSPQQEAQQWQDELRKREGVDGTYWRLLEVDDLVDELAAVEDLNRRDPRLREAKRAVDKILTFRPRWAEAVTMQGRIAALEDRPENAVESFQRAIEAGDRRLRTRQALWEQLVRLDRAEEAEADMRLAAAKMSTQIDKYGLNRVRSALLKGNFERSVEVAREAAEKRPGDFLGHVVLCRTATVAALGSQDPEVRRSLFDTAEDAIRRAGEVADREQPTIYSARLNLHRARDNKKGLLQTIAKLEKSDLDEFDRSVLTANAHLALGNNESALALLERADKLRPSSQTQLQLARVYRRLNRYDEEIESLRRAQQRSPNNVALRQQLARSLVLRDPENVDWVEVSRLLNAGDDDNQNNRLQFAVLMGFRGDSTKRERAATILRELVNENNHHSEDAARYLAVLLQRRLTDSGNASDPQSERWSEEIRGLYQRLLDSDRPEVADQYRFADYLLSDLDQDDRGSEDMKTVASLADALQKRSAGIVPALDINIRHALAADGPEAAVQAVQRWQAIAQQDEQLSEQNIPAIAAAVLMKRGLAEQGLTWLEKAYQEEPKLLGNYVLALNQQQRFREAAEVSLRHYQEHHDLPSAVLLLESMISAEDFSLTEAQKDALADGKKRFGDKPAWLESAGTLALFRGRFPEAIRLLEKSRKLDPLRVRTLNNLAIAMAEDSDRAAEAVAPIDQAIKLFGADPELLDTKGVVLMKAGQPRQAADVFREAVTKRDEPRFKFHLVLALIEQDAVAEAQRIWGTIDVEGLNPSGLMPSERHRLTQLKQEFGS